MEKERKAWKSIWRGDSVFDYSKLSEYSKDEIEKELERQLTNFTLNKKEIEILLIELNGRK